jgi:hypothetical protein
VPAEHTGHKARIAMHLPRPLIPLLSLLAAAALASPAGASAAARATAFRVPASAAAYSAAHAVAVAHWGTDPCGGTVAIAWTSMHESINAVSDWTNPTSLYGNPAANGHCTITYNRREAWSWPMFCTITEHELGHLAGHQHVDDPNDVMSPYYTHPSPECLRTPAPATAASAGSAAASAPTSATRAHGVRSRRASTHRRSHGHRRRSHP